MSGIIAALAAVLVTLSAACNHIEPAAQAASARATQAQATGDILGMVSDPQSIRDGFVRLGDSGPAVPVTSDGNFTFRSVQPGCYDLHLIEEGHETLAIESSAACVSAGHATVLSIIFGRI